MINQARERRTLLKAAGLAALTVATGTHVTGSRAAQQVPYSSGTEVPKLKAPANACDSHMHIYDNRFPYVANASLRPPPATVADYRLLQKRLGTTRNVVVQPSSYGTDNRCTLDAVAQLGPTARAVAVVDTTVSDEELRRLAAAGVRGIRFNLVQKGATTVDMMAPLATRINDLGWHMQIHMLGDQIAQIEDVLQQLPCPIVFDHFGRISGSVGVGHPAFRVIRKLIDANKAWVKLSSAYLNTTIGGPTYADMTELAIAYVQAAPQRMVWGTDWPHPTEKENKPDDALLFDLLAEWVPIESTLHRMLVDNPEVLYGFPKAG